MIKGLEALCYLDDIAHGRKMSLDPHELKLIVEKELTELEQLRKLKLLPYPKENDDEYRQGIIKRLKALEILRAFDFEIEDYNEDFNGSLKVNQTRIILDDEEIDLLKEVLL